MAILGLEWKYLQTVFVVFGVAVIIKKKERTCQIKNIRI